MAHDVSDYSPRGANNSGVAASRLRMSNPSTSIPRESPVSAGRPALVTSGEFDWVVRVMRKEGPGILRMLWRILGQEQDVMDAYQDCFCKLACRKGGGKIDSAKAYAYRTAGNIAIELIRGRNRRAAHWTALAASQCERMQPNDGTCDRRQSDERLPLLREAVARLPQHLRNVVVLRDMSRMPYAQVGRVLGIDAGTARVYRRHAVVKLAEWLNKEANDDQG